MTVGGPLPPNLRALLLVGDFFLGGVISVSLTKLLLRLRALGGAAAAPQHVNKAGAQAMLAIVSIMRLGESPLLPTPLDGEWLVGHCCDFCVCVFWGGSHRLLWGVLGFLFRHVAGAGCRWVWMGSGLH